MFCYVIRFFVLFAYFRIAALPLTSAREFFRVLFYFFFASPLPLLRNIIVMLEMKRYLKIKAIATDSLSLSRKVVVVCSGQIKKFLFCRFLRPDRRNHLFASSCTHILRFFLRMRRNSRQLVVTSTTLLENFPVICAKSRSLRVLLILHNRKHAVQDTESADKKRDLLLIASLHVRVRFDEWNGLRETKCAEKKSALILSQHFIFLNFIDRNRLHM